VAAASGPVSAAPQAESDEETRSAHEALRSAAEQLAKVKVPMSTEPACHFRP
jgi:hypothetical protein